MNISLTITKKENMNEEVMINKGDSIVIIQTELNNRKNVIEIIQLILGYEGYKIDIRGNEVYHNDKKVYNLEKINLDNKDLDELKNTIEKVAEDIKKNIIQGGD